ncbi:MAG: glycosyltransferase family 4 protein [Vicinamibacterales bacterium]
MRILVDYRPALRARTGVGEYMHGLARAYAAAWPDDTVAVFTSSWKDRPREGLATELGADVVDRRVPVSLLNYLWHRRGWPPIERLAGPLDIVHAAHPLRIPARRAAQVITIHDLFFMTAPGRTHAEIRRDYAELTPSHALAAHAIVTPTRHVKRLVETTLRVPGERVFVCAGGAPEWQGLGGAPNVPADGYVLFLGTLEPRKNIGTLLDAWTLLVARGVTTPLMVAGRAGDDARPWIERMQRPPLAGHVTYAGYVQDHAREDLYRGARAVVLPSLDEGFGFPALEAMSAGVPLVASTRGSLPEVAGDAGVLVDPEDAAALADALQRIVTDQAFALGRANAGLVRARAFSWASAAQSLREAYLEASARRQAEREARAHRG